MAEFEPKCRTHKQARVNLKHTLMQIESKSKNTKSTRKNARNSITDLTAKEYTRVD